MKHLIDALSNIKGPDIAVLTKIAEFIIVIMGSVGVGLFKSRNTATDKANAAASKARAEEEASRQQVIANFNQLVSTFETRVNDLTARLAVSDAALTAERSSSLERQVKFVTFVRRYLRKHPIDMLEPEDVDLLTALGVEVIQLNRADKGTDTGETQTC